MNAERIHGRRAFLCVVAAAELGCNAVLGIDYGHSKPVDASAVDSPVEDAGGDDATGEETPTPGADASDADLDSGEAATPCSVRWPAPPDRDDISGGSDVTFLVAAEGQTLKIAPSDDLGLDLDQRCTCLVEGPAGGHSCNPGSLSLANLLCDAPGGRDQTGNHFLESWVGLGASALSESALQRDMLAGRAGALVRVNNYNGTANDHLVSVEFFGRAWMQAEGGVPRAPRRDGTDPWTIYSESVLVSTLSVDNDAAAYVRDHLLVAHLNTATLALRPNTGAYDNPLYLALRNAMLTGTIVPTNGGYRLEGAQLVGRWPVDTALASFASLADLDGGFVCGSSSLFAALQSYACGAVDIMSKPGEDNTGADCDAISFAFGFDASPARLEGVLTPSFVRSSCPVGWSPTCPPRAR